MMPHVCYAAPNRKPVYRLLNGGLDLAVESALEARTVWTSDIDPGACKIISHRFPDAPNVGDITTIDWATVPPVDIITGGFPCQDLSHAGKRAGMHTGTRSGLWSHMAAAIETIRPRMVVAENVRGLLSADATSDLEPCPWCMGDGPPEHALRALGCVLGDLADIGYDAQWRGLRAADTGAPHGRFRVFVVASDANASDGHGWPTAGQQREARPQARSAAWPTPTDTRRVRGDQGRFAAPGQAQGGQPLALSGVSRGVDSPPDASSDGWDEGRTESARDGRQEGHEGSGGTEPAQRGRTVADTDDDGRAQLGRVEPVERDADRCSGPDIAWGDYEPAIRRWESILGRPAPAPTETGTKGGQRLSPRFTEWMMGVPGGWIVDTPGLTRNEALKACGNGVVPQQAAAAIRAMLTAAQAVA